jgi:hypothetical protein
MARHSVARVERMPPIAADRGRPVAPIPGTERSDQRVMGGGCRCYVFVRFASRLDWFACVL